MRRAASGRTKSNPKGQVDADRIAICDVLRCDVVAGDLKVHHPDYDNWGAIGRGPVEIFTEPVNIQCPDRSMRSGGYYTVYPRGRGASAGPIPHDHVRVSRWASPDEAGGWLENAGTAVPSGTGGDRLYVALPGATQPGGTGPVRVDFAIPRAALMKTGRADWRMIMQPIQSTPVHNVIITIPDGVMLPDAK
jgi:hypothetical protein